MNKITKKIIMISLSKFALSVAFVASCLLSSVNGFTQETKKIETFYSNGQVKEQYYVNTDGLKHGNFMLFYPNGKKQMKIDFENGKKHGEFLTWHENGKIKEKSHYVANKREQYVAYDELGNIVEERR